MGKIRVRTPPRMRRLIKSNRNSIGDSWQGAFKDPELRWMDQLLRSFSQETPVEWMPSQYQSILQQRGVKKPTLH